MKNGTKNLDFKLMYTEFLVHNEWINISPIPMVFPIDRDVPVDNIKMTYEWVKGLDTSKWL